ncbi:MAG: DUF460 domain-containing protein [Candidatus Woesearchaeota archaeon]
MKRPIIVGIDPGTTTAVAVLSIHKEVLLLESGRKMGFDNLLSRVIEFGIPLVVGCDKKDIPDFVSRFAAKTGARIKPPVHDILVSEKRELAGNCKNDHERDALASAYYAYSKIQSQLTKILKHTEDPEIITLVVKHDFSIRQATDIVSSPDKPEKRSSLRPSSLRNVNLLSTPSMEG